MQPTSTIASDGLFSYQIRPTNQILQSTLIHVEFTVSNGNGTNEYSVKITEFPDQGHVVFYADDDHPPPAAELPTVLGHALQDWMGENPDVVVRSSLPIVQNGQTIAIHLWYDPSTID